MLETLKFIALCAAFMPAISAFSQNNAHQQHHCHAALVPPAAQSNSHLHTHLKQTALLSSEQLASYASLRGIRSNLSEVIDQIRSF